jgi:hypothetical protein
VGVGWFEIWVVIFASIASLLTYRLGLLFETRWPALGSLVFMSLSLTALVLSWTAAVHVSGTKQAACEEAEVTADRLNGSSRAEFRERCIATLSISNSLDWR